MRPIFYEDMSVIEKFFSEIYLNAETKSLRLKHLKHELYQRDVLGNADHSVFKFGIFKGEHLIGVSDGGLQNTHGFLINNCVVTSALKEYATEELYQYAFKFVTNAALERGALPVDDIQTYNTEEKNKSGIFNSDELGYKTVMSACTLK